LSGKMQLHGLEQMVAADGLLRRLTRLSGFRGLLDDYRHAFSSDLGLVVTTDGDALSRTFFDWMEAVDRDARFCAVDRRDFLVFSAGLLLREFLRHGPCAIEGGSGEPRSPSLDAIVIFTANPSIAGSGCFVSSRNRASVWRALPIAAAITGSLSATKTSSSYSAFRKSELRVRAVRPAACAAPRISAKPLDVRPDGCDDDMRAAFPSRRATTRRTTMGRRSGRQGSMRQNARGIGTP